MKSKRKKIPLSSIVMLVLFVIIVYEVGVRGSLFWIWVGEGGGAGPSIPMSGSLPIGGRLHTDGTNIKDAGNHIVTLAGAHISHNEYSHGYFSAVDVTRMQSHGGNCLEIHALRLGYLEPSRGVYDTAGYVAKLDSYVNICEAAHIYCIISIEDLSYTTYGSGMPNWMLDGHGYGAAPYSQATVNRACLDFWDLDNPLHNDNRASFIDLWKFLATRYKTKDYVLFGIINEPLSHLTLSSRTQSQHLGETYATFMGQIVDAIHAITNQIVVIDKPFLWYMADIQPIAKVNIIWESHEYSPDNTPTGITTWKGYIDADITLFVNTFGKPLHIGEYGPREGVVNPTGWQSIWTDEALYLRGKAAIGRLAGYTWLEWGVLFGEDGHQFSASDSEILLNIVYSGT